MARVSASGLILLVFIVGSALSGCIGDSLDDRSPWLEPVVVTDPGDRGYDPTRTQIHDYWNGKDTLPVMNRTFAPRFQYPFPPEDNRWTLVYLPHDGKIIPDGTSSLSVTVTWNELEPFPPPSNAYGDLEFWMKPTNTSDARLVRDPLVSGETFEVPVDPDETDLPHQLVSGWEFEVHILRGEDNDLYTRFHANVQVEIDAHRGPELRTWPPHPDHWHNGTEIQLVDETVPFTRVNRPTGGYDGASNPVLRPPTGTMVPWGADRIAVDLTPHDDAVGALELSYRGADTRNWTAIEPHDEQGTTVRYVIYITDDMADSPHARASLWQFLVRAPEGISPGDDPPMFDGEFTLKAVVYRV